MSMTLTYSATSVSLPGNRYNLPYPQFIQEQELSVAEDGTVYVSSCGVEEIIISVRVRINNTTRSALRSFIRSTVNYQERTFTLTPDSSIDLGSGAGVGVSVRLWENSFSEVPIPYGFWEVAFVLRGTIVAGP